MTAEPIQLLFVNDPHAPEIFASGCKGIGFDGPNARLTFVSMRVNHATNPGPIEEVVNGRVVMSIESAKNMAEFILRSLAQREQQPAPNITPGQTLQ